MLNVWCLPVWKREESAVLEQVAADLVEKLWLSNLLEKRTIMKDADRDITKWVLLIDSYIC